MLKLFPKVYAIHRQALPAASLLFERMRSVSLLFFFHGVFFAHQRNDDRRCDMDRDEPALAAQGRP